MQGPQSPHRGSAWKLLPLASRTKAPVKCAVSSRGRNRRARPQACGRPSRVCRGPNQLSHGPSEKAVKAAPVSLSPKVGLLLPQTPDPTVPQDGRGQGPGQSGRLLLGQLSGSSAGSLSGSEVGRVGCFFPVGLPGHSRHGAPLEGNAPQRQLSLVRTAVLSRGGHVLPQNCSRDPLAAP